MTSHQLLNCHQPTLCESGHCVELIPPAKSIPNIETAIAAALQRPLDFPPFSAAIVDDDQIAVAVDSSIPSLSAVILGAVDYLLHNQATLDHISVVLSPCSDTTLQTVRDNLPPHLHQKLAIFVHHPEEQNDLGYLAASSEEALPIYVNRRLLDADIVLPITLFHSPHSIDYSGTAGIFPLFADSEAMKRYSSLSNLGSPTQNQKRCRDAEEAAWLLGTQCIVKVVPAGNGEILKIVAGLPSAIENELQAETTISLEVNLKRSADLVIAQIDGEPNEQTWPNVARALHAARSAIGNQGTIVLRTQITQSPGASLRRLTSLESPEKIEKQLSKESGPDTLTASLLSEYLQRARIFMQSRLPQEEIEDLGIGYVADDQQLEKLVAASQHCLWLPSAQHFTIIRNETEPPATQKAPV
jgi:nickel-dependent lactate racemase